MTRQIDHQLDEQMLVESLPRRGDEITFDELIARYVQGKSGSALYHWVRGSIFFVFSQYYKALRRLNTAEYIVNYTPFPSKMLKIRDYVVRRISELVPDAKFYYAPACDPKYMPVWLPCYLIAMALERGAKKTFPALALEAKERWDTVKNRFRKAVKPYIEITNPDQIFEYILGDPDPDKIYAAMQEYIRSEKTESVVSAALSEESEEEEKQ